MGWGNGPPTWAEMERVLSGLPGRGAAPPGDGGDSPAWSHTRGEYRAGTRPEASGPLVPYAELHTHSAYSFLDGACQPEEMVEEAVRLGLDALALTDHNGFYGVVRFAEAAAAVGMPTAFGAELKVLADDPTGTAHHALILARDPTGYAALARTISRAQMAGEKGAPRLTEAELSEAAAGAQGHWLALTGCRQGAVPAALVAHGPAAAERELAKLVDRFGRGNVAVELWDHGDPLDAARNDALVQLA